VITSTTTPPTTTTLRRLKIQSTPLLILPNQLRLSGLNRLTHRLSQEDMPLVRLPLSFITLLALSLALFVRGARKLIFHLLPQRPLLRLAAAAAFALDVVVVVVFVGVFGCVVV